MITQEIQEQIESYVAGKMPAAERGSFEKMIQQDKHLAEAVRQHQLMADSFATFSRRTKLKKQFDSFHKEWKEESKEQPFIYTYGVRAFWRNHMTTVAVAASVAVITVFSTIFMTNYLRSLEHQQVSNYAELKKENNHIKKRLSDISASLQQDVTTAADYAASATGFMISPNGYIVTNRHVVSGADEVYVESTNYENIRQRYKAKVIHKDQKLDLALLKISDSTFKPLTYMPYALNTRETDLGESVYTLAYPREDIVYGDGAISAHTGNDGDTSKYQISVPVNPGNSGAPLLDAKGNLVGIVTGKNPNEDGAAFAIKSKHLFTLVQEIPADSLTEPLTLPRKNYMHYLRRPDQIKKLQGLVFNVKVYKK
ncbi:serine protease [Cytophagaceae bacterium DM2B3-1]|uniref:Serine protease n=1 Tax=Xanthocytophaga flava TaxID=3048013 RepID=A0ABT7CFQ7_9BACT|nr:serine protease [Xanthocytophaga flavus]MDJ1466574.1 serine protease [Xanthocytophaga flavus]MDJ1492572.1 serine protease [Xanthocytophaga flavus]